jgi:hypothetical protein
MGGARVESTWEPAELERTIAAAGFTHVRVAVQPNSRALMESWSPGNGQFVASALIEGIKER